MRVWDRLTQADPFSARDKACSLTPRSLLFLLPFFSHSPLFLDRKHRVLKWMRAFFGGGGFSRIQSVERQSIMIQAVQMEFKRQLQCVSHRRLNLRNTAQSHRGRECQHEEQYRRKHDSRTERNCCVIIEQGSRQRGMSGDFKIGILTLSCFQGCSNFPPLGSLLWLVSSSNPEERSSLWTLTSRININIHGYPLLCLNPCHFSRKLNSCPLPWTFLASSPIYASLFFSFL